MVKMRSQVKLVAKTPKQDKCTLPVHLSRLRTHPMSRLRGDSTKRSPFESTNKAWRDYLYILPPPSFSYIHTPYFESFRERERERGKWEICIPPSPIHKPHTKSTFHMVLFIFSSTHFPPLKLGLELKLGNSEFALLQLDSSTNLRGINPIKLGTLVIKLVFKLLYII